MTRSFCTLLASAALAASLLAGCETDESLPTHPRTATPFTPDAKAQENAEQRALEKPARDLPTGTGAEFPGRSSAAPASAGDARVLTMDVPAAAPSPDQAAPDSVLAPAAAPAPASVEPAAAANLEPVPAHGFIIPKGWRKFGQSYGPTTVYNNDTYPGPLPHIPENPGTVPMPGSTPAPGGDWNIDHSWGQGLVLENYPHRAWPESTAVYLSGSAKHDPLYYFNIQEQLKHVRQNDGTLRGDWRSTAYEVPWFYLNTAALPVLMVLEPPLAQRTTYRDSADPNFRGYLPEGPTVPVPTPGVLTWEYPFLNPDGTVKEPKDITSTTIPSMTMTPATAPSGGR